MNLEMQLHCLRGLCSAGKTVYLGMWPKPAAGFTNGKASQQSHSCCLCSPHLGSSTPVGGREKDTQVMQNVASPVMVPGYLLPVPVVFAGMSLSFWNSGTGSAPLEGLLHTGGSMICTPQWPKCASPQHLLCKSDNIKFTKESWFHTHFSHFLAF